MSPMWKLFYVGILLPSVLAYAMPGDNPGKLPTLGWNSWNAYQCNITEDRLLDAAQALIDTGLRDAGYNYVNIDDCWAFKEGRIDGHLAPNTTRFPDGIKGLADTIHSMNLSLGIYSSAGNLTCAKYPASLEHEDVDASDFASWGIDYLKYDNCGIPKEWEDQYVDCTTDDKRINVTTNGTCTSNIDADLAPSDYDWHTSNTFKRFTRMRDALSRQPRKILLSLCVWGTADVYSWGRKTGANWRVSRDIGPTWNSIMRITNINSFHMHSTDFWGHNDADMLEVGNGNLTYEETRSHFALWAMMKSPLFIGTDLTNLSDANVKLLKNSYLLAFNQDETHGAPATPYKWGTNGDWAFNETWPAEYWAGQSEQGTMVLMVNPSNDTSQVMRADWAEIPGLVSGRLYKVTDVWIGQLMDDCVSGGYWVEVQPHDSAVILVSDVC